MPRKPDRFERIAEKACMDWVNGEQVEGWKSVSVKLLREEHAWMERMVRKVSNWQAEQLADNDDACSVILEQLKKRRK